MSGTTSFFVDCASYQGLPVWAKAAAVCIGGAEKVTEGTGYVNPFWAKSKTAMLALAPHGFVPVAYMFLDATGSGGAQADAFASHAGDLAKFGIAVDFERAQDGSPTNAQAKEAIAELRKLYPHHPIGLYAPKWYAGGEDLSFGDWLWASEYVNGSGDPAMLYKSVPASWWAPYGAVPRPPLMLQFTSKATIAGISGEVDCSAYPGTAAQLAARVLVAAPKPPVPPVPPKETTVADAGTLMTLGVHEHVNIPVSEAFPSKDFAIVVTGDTGALVTATAWFTDGSAAQQVTVPLGNGRASRVIFRRLWEGVTVVRLQRADSKADLAASAFVRF